MANQWSLPWNGWIQPTASHPRSLGSIIGLHSLFWKNKSKLMRSPCCVSVLPPPPHQLSNAWTTTYETCYVGWNLSPSQQHTSEIRPIRRCVCLYTPVFATQRFGTYILVTKNTSNSRRIIWLVILLVYSILVISKESQCVYLCVNLTLLGNALVSTFPLQRSVVGGVVFMRSLSYEKKVDD
jgi:hypothetical protein